MSEDPLAAPAEELRALTHGLRRHLRRRQVLGDRRVDLAQAPVPGAAPVTPPAEPAAPAQARPEAPAPAAPPAVAPSATQPSATQPEPTQPAGAPGDFPASWGETPREKDETERRAAWMAQAAAECPDLPALQERVAACNACSLCQTRTRSVFMDGTGPARILFVGEAPGYHEDQQGVPFVGRAGQLLTDIVQKGMGLDRSEVAIANVLKCRPPENRDPLPVEKRLCTTWLDRQIELLQPEMLIALGRHAAGHLLDTDSSMARLRGRVWLRNGRKVVATYHPAYLLRSPGEKKECWKDIQLAMAELGLQPPR